jgi:hypothetical protein
MTSTQERLEEIRAEAVGLLHESHVAQLKALNELLAENACAVLQEDSKTNGPMSTPKNLVTALHIRQAWQWGPPGARIELTLSRTAGTLSQRARRAIEFFRRRLT